MNKMKISQEICRLPIIDMNSGSVVAHSTVPYFDKESLRFCGFRSEDKPEISVPFAALGFVNELCIMAKNISNFPMPDSDSLCRLLGEPLTAAVGSVSLFRFGEISAVDITEDGSIEALHMSDGTVCPISGNGTPAVLSEGLRKQLHAAAAEAAPAPAAESSFPAGKPVPNEGKEPVTPAPEEDPVPEITLTERKVPDLHPGKRTAAPEIEILSKDPLLRTPEVSEPKMKEPSRLRTSNSEIRIPTGKTVSFERNDTAKEIPTEDTDSKKEPAAAAEKKSFFQRISWKDLFRRYGPPLIAMLVYFCIYFYAMTHFLKVK